MNWCVKVPVGSGHIVEGEVGVEVDEGAWVEHMLQGLNQEFSQLEASPCFDCAAPSYQQE